MTTPVDVPVTIPDKPTINEGGSPKEAGRPRPVVTPGTGPRASVKIEAHFELPYFSFTVMIYFLEGTL